MIRTVSRKSVFVALATMFAGAAVVGCSNNDSKPNNVGAVGLAIEVSPGINVNSVRYVVSGNGITPIQGDINVADSAATVSVLINGIPAGSPYAVNLTAQSTDMLTNCAGAATGIVVAANMTVGVNIVMQCRGPNTRGSILVNGTFNDCPQVASYTAAPLAVSTGGVIAVTSTASDLDPGSMLTFAWTATGGTFAAGTSANTTYNCTQAGPQTLTITVSDGICTDAQTVLVNCVAILCGNGAVNPGENCDPPGSVTAGVTCPSDCTTQSCGDNVMEGTETCDDGNTANGDNCPSTCILPVCGLNGVEAGEQCDPPQANLCSATCQLIAFCSNGRTDAGETCDDGNTTAGDGCSATCQTETVTPPGAVCGNGTVSGAEVCDDGNTVGGDVCARDCSRTNATAACLACEVTNACTSDGVTGCGIYAAGSMLRTQCEDVLDCVHRTKCSGLDPAAGAAGCYCPVVNGVVDLGLCNTAPNGPCQAVIEAAVGSTTPATVQARITDVTYAAAGAFNMGNCDAVNCFAECVQ